VVLVRSAVLIARRLGMSELLIGITLVGIGTSSPELVASLTAAVRGSPGIAIGNVLGSNICNILLILGASAAVAPIAADRRAFLRDGTAMLAASVALVAACLAETIDRVTGALFLAALAGYLVHACRSDGRGALPPPSALAEAGEESHAWPRSLTTATGAALLSLVGLTLGATLLVDGAIALARTAGVSETVIGLTLVAVGTSLPEFATSLAAAVRRHPEVALGNSLGSNIYNALGIVGATALVQPIAVPEEVIRLDVWVMLASTVALSVVVLGGGGVRRWQGVLFLLAYAAFLVLLAVNGGSGGGG
jgi:cation:H+ antiporter